MNYFVCYNVTNILDATDLVIQHPTIIIGNDKQNDNLVNTSAWFSDGFIYGFTNIVNHDAHKSVMPYRNDGVVVLLVDCPIHEILPYESSTTHFVSVCARQGLRLGPTVIDTR